MRLSRIIAIVLSGLAIFLAGSGGFARERVGNLTTVSNFPPVDPKVLAEWKKNLFETDEIWILNSEDEFFKTMQESGLAPDVISELKSGVRNQIPYSDEAKVLTFHNFENAQGFIFVPLALKYKMPEKSLQSAYSYLIRTKHDQVHTKFSSPMEATAYFEKYGLTGTELQYVLNHTYKIEDAYYFFYTQDVWTALPESLKTDLINYYVNKTDGREGLKVELTYTKKDDLRKIAKRYAGEREPRTIERYLRIKLSQSKKGSVTIPLETILHPFIRKTVNTYPSCSGPNCFNAGVSINKGKDFDQEYIATDDALLNSVYSRYRFVSPGEALKAGDMLIYRGTKDKIIHVSTYIVDDIVYSKNGLHKFNPYIFQPRSLNEKIYFKDQKFRLMVLRISQPGEAVASAGGVEAFKGKGREVYYLDQVNPPHIVAGHDVTTSPKEAISKSSWANLKSLKDAGLRQCGWFLEGLANPLRN